MTKQQSTLYKTTDLELLAYEMRELTDKQLRNAYHNNAPGQTLRLINGEFAKARYQAAYIEQKARRAAKAK